MQKIMVSKNAYYDSTVLMRVAREVSGMPGIVSASLSMGTDSNKKIMMAARYDLTGVEAGPNDLIIGLMGDADSLAAALDRAREYIVDPPWKKSLKTDEYRPRSLDTALSVQPDSNLAIVSVAGRYAAELGMSCLERNLNVMIYSDNVALEEEIRLKRYAAEKGLLVMGPDCGTVIVRGVAMGMANRCPTGPVGIVAASGTGLQEVHVQLARRGVGTLHGIGTGGRDVRDEVGGTMTTLALELLLQSPEVEVVCVVGKPPSVRVENLLKDIASAQKKPVVFGFMGGHLKDDYPPLYFCGELEETAAVAAALATGKSLTSARAELRQQYAALVSTVEKTGRRRGFLRGLYSGGTLCYEAQLIARDILGPVYSNVPLDESMRLEDSLRSVEHSIVDYGEDEFTQGHLHPMIDLSFRVERLCAEASDPGTAVVLFDVVLGYGCNEDPASRLAEGVVKARSVNRDLVCVASICGTDGDPQKASVQRRVLEKAGVLVCDSNAQAARLAAGLTGR